MWLPSSQRTELLPSASAFVAAGWAEKHFQVQFLILPPKVGTFGLAPVSNFILLRYLDWSSFIIALLTLLIFADTVGAG